MLFYDLVISQLVRYLSPTFPSGFPFFFLQKLQQQRNLHSILIYPKTSTNAVKQKLRAMNEIKVHPSASQVEVLIGFQNTKKMAALRRSIISLRNIMKFVKQCLKGRRKS